MWPPGSISQQFWSRQGTVEWGGSVKPRRLPTSHTFAHTKPRAWGYSLNTGLKLHGQTAGCGGAPKPEVQSPPLSGPPPPRPRRRPCPRPRASLSRVSNFALPLAAAPPHPRSAPGPPRRGRVPTPQARAPRPALASAAPPLRLSQSQVTLAPGEAVPGGAGGGLRAGGGRGGPARAGREAWPAPALAAGLGCGVGKSREELTAPPPEPRLPGPREGGREEEGREGAASRSASVAPARLRPARSSPRWSALARKRPLRATWTRPSTWGARTITRGERGLGGSCPEPEASGSFVYQRFVGHPRVLRRRLLTEQGKVLPGILLSGGRSRSACWGGARHVGLHSRGGARRRGTRLEVCRGWRRRVPRLSALGTGTHTSGRPRDAPATEIVLGSTFKMGQAKREGGKKDF